MSAVATLFRLQQLDTERDRLRARIKAIDGLLAGPAELRTTTAALQAAEKAVSHNVQKSGSDNPNHFYGEDVWGKIAEKYNLAETLPENLIFYGEIVGEGIQDLTYGYKKHSLFIFDIKDVTTGKYLDWYDVVRWCEHLGLQIVPELYAGQYSDELRKQFTTGKSTIDGKTIREGIVLKTITESNNPKIGRKILKSVSEEYLLRKNGTEFK